MRHRLAQRIYRALPVEMLRAEKPLARSLGTLKGLEMGRGNDADVGQTSVSSFICHSIADEGLGFVRLAMGWDEAPIIESELIQARETGLYINGRFERGIEVAGYLIRMVISAKSILYRVWKGRVSLESLAKASDEDARHWVIPHCGMLRLFGISNPCWSQLSEFTLEVYSNYSNRVSWCRMAKLCDLRLLCWLTEWMEKCRRFEIYKEGPFVGVGSNLTHSSVSLTSSVALRAQALFHFLYNFTHKDGGLFTIVMTNLL